MKWRTGTPSDGQIRITKKIALWPVKIQGWFVWFEWYNLQEYYTENKWLFKDRTFCDKNHKHPTHIVIPIDEYNFTIEKKKNVAYLVERSLRAKLPNKYLKYTEDPFCPEAPIQNPTTFIQIFTKTWVIIGLILGILVVGLNFTTLFWFKIVVSTAWILWGLFVFIIKRGFDVD